MMRATLCRCKKLLELLAASVFLLKKCDEPVMLHLRTTRE
jgi:hypothetical protein